MLVGIKRCAPVDGTSYVNKKSRRNRICRHAGCTTHRSFGSSTDKVALYCAKHKLPEHVDVKNKTCLYAGCKTGPTYGSINDGIALYCAKHKQPEHVDVKSKTCSHAGCKTRPTYGFIGDGIALYCVSHKLPEHVDVKHKTCLHAGCTTRAGYGTLFGRKAHCGEHKLPNEYSKNHPKCGHVGCSHQPCYTNTGQNYPLRCEEHMLTDDVNVVERPCQKCGLPFHLKDGNLCNDCNEFFMSKVRLVKQTSLKQFLESNGVVITQYDRRVDGGCSLKRPDIVVDCDSFIIVVECDEDQHSNYLCSCEQGRMVTLFNDFGGLPVCFIRYNPDSYTDNCGIRVTTKSPMARQKRLLSLIRSMQLHPPSAMLSAVYLYYDGEDGVNRFINVDYESSTVQEL